MGDPQRSLIYRTEGLFSAELSAPDLSIRECQSFASKVMTFPTWLQLSTSQAPVVVIEGITSQANPNGTLFTLAQGHRNQQGVLHEMAHMLLLRSKLRYTQLHGPLYATVLIRLWYDHDHELADRWKTISLREEVRTLDLVAR